MRALGTLFLLLILALPAQAQGGAPSNTDAGTTTPVIGGIHGWHRTPGRPGWWTQYESGVPIWAYHETTGEWQQYRNGAWHKTTWGKPSAKPNFGVDEGKLQGSGLSTTYKITRKCRCGTTNCPGVRTTTLSAGEAFEALQGGPLVDDSSKGRITIIGTEAERQRVRGELATSPLLAPFKEHYLVKDYPPGHWAVRTVGMTLDGVPAIYVQAPDGKVLHKQADYTDGAQALAIALRKVDPNYDPNKDPDVRKPPKPPDKPVSPALPALASVPAGAWVLAGLIGLGLFWRKS